MTDFILLAAVSFDSTWGTSTAASGGTHDVMGRHTKVVVNSRCVATSGASGCAAERQGTDGITHHHDVDGIAAHGSTRNGGAQDLCTALSLDERAAAHLPSGSSGLNCIGVKIDTRNAAERRLVDGINHPHAPQLRKARADKMYGILAALKR